MTPSYLPFPQVTRRSSAALFLGALSSYLIEKQPLVHGVVETLPSGHIRTCPLGWWRREASRQAASAPQRALRSQRTPIDPPEAPRPVLASRFKLAPRRGGGLALGSGRPAPSFRVLLLFPAGPGSARLPGLSRSGGQ